MKIFEWFLARRSCLANLDYLHPGELQCMRCGCGWAGELRKCRQGPGGRGHGEQGHGVQGHDVQGHGGQGHGEQGHDGQEPGGRGRCRLGVGARGRCRQVAGDGEHRSALGGWSTLRKTMGCLGTWQSGTGPASGTIKK